MCPLCRYDEQGTGRVDVRSMCADIVSIDHSIGSATTPRQRQPFTPRDSRNMISHEPLTPPDTHSIAKPLTPPYAMSSRAPPRSVSVPRMRDTSEHDIISWSKKKEKQSSPAPASQLATPAKFRTPVATPTKPDTRVDQAPRYVSLITLAELSLL